MNAIRQILAQEACSIESLIYCMELVREEGNVAVIKLDGLRSGKQYTVFITPPNGNIDEIIRADEATLEAALRKVLAAYVKNN